MNVASICDIGEICYETRKRTRPSTRGSTKHKSRSDHLDGPDIMVRNRADFRLDDAHTKAGFPLLFFGPTERQKMLSDKAKGSPACHMFPGVDCR